MKVKLQSSNKLELVKAVKDMADLGLKEAKDLVDEQEKVFGCPSNAKWCVVIDSEKTEEQIRAIAKGYNVTHTPLCDLDVCEQKQQEEKLQEVTEDDLGILIHSIGKTPICWQRKALFSHEQATRVMAGLHDAKFNVTETHVMHEGRKATMLVVNKIFPTGTKKKDLEKFENLIHTFMLAVCEVVNLEEMIEGAKERAIEAFDNLQDYE